MQISEFSGNLPGQAVFFRVCTTCLIIRIRRLEQKSDGLLRVHALNPESTRCGIYRYIWIARCDENVPMCPNRDEIHDVQVQIICTVENQQPGLD